MVTLCASISIVMFADSVNAQQTNPKAIFYNETVLRGAVAVIAQMTESELRAFTHYLSECQDEREGFGKHACLAAEGTYEIEYGTKRPLDDLIYARSVMLDLPDDVNINDAANLADTAIKYGKVIGGLEDAAKARFRILKTSAK